MIRFFRILQANRRGDGERCGRRKNGRGGEERVRNQEREEGVRWDIEKKELIAEENERYEMYRENLW